MEKRSKHKFDLDFRPESYWDGAGGPNVDIRGERESLGLQLRERDQQFREFSSDAPRCYRCGCVTVQNGACHRCYNCGESMGCS